MKLSTYARRIKRRRGAKVITNSQFVEHLNKIPDDVWDELSDKEQSVINKIVGLDNDLTIMVKKAQTGK